MNIRSYALVLFTVLVAACATAAQTTPSPTPPEDVVKIATNLIQVDVTVTDAQGRVVTDLKSGEIELYENGTKREIKHFSFVSATRESTRVKATDNAAPAPPVTLRAEQVRRSIALVVDDLNLSFESAYSTRQGLKKFVDEQMQDGDLVAIIRTGAGIGALQQFTTDKRLLYAAIERVKWNPSGTGNISAFEPITPPTPATTPTPESPTVDGGDQGLDDFRSSVFATGTLGALKYVVTGMAQMPGRKSVVLFSDGFKLYETSGTGFSTAGRVLDFMKVLVDASNRNSVTFYTVDARGLQTTYFTAADNPGTMDPAALNSTISSRSAQLKDTQAGLQYLAEQTGGQTLVNNNDLGRGVQRILGDESYYLVAYEPDEATFNAKERRFNELTVKVLRPGVKVRYRSGFFNNPSRVPTVATAKRGSPFEQLEQALASPFAASGINLRLNALYGDDGKTGPFVMSLLHIDAHDLKFTDDGGRKRASIEVLAIVFGDNGQVVDRLSKSYTLSVPANRYQKIVNDGFLYEFTFPVKLPGPYQYRVAIRDAAGGEMGSASQFVEVPDLKKRKLTLSSLVIQGLTTGQWEGLKPTTDNASSAFDYTAVRRIATGNVLRYGYEIYNAETDRSRKPQLTAKIRLFRDGKSFFEGKQTPVDLTRQSDLQHIRNTGALEIGKMLPIGDYVLQVVVTDDVSKEKQRTATQFIEFEVVGP